jgi:hypothetical protein
VAFLLGVLKKMGVFSVVNRGEFVVDCVVNVVFLQSVFRRRKM